MFGVEVLNGGLCLSLESQSSFTHAGILNDLHLHLFTPHSSNKHHTNTSQMTNLIVVIYPQTQNKCCFIKSISNYVTLYNTAYPMLSFCFPTLSVTYYTGGFTSMLNLFNWFNMSEMTTDTDRWHQIWYILLCYSVFVMPPWVLYLITYIFIVTGYLYSYAFTHTSVRPANI